MNYTFRNLTSMDIFPLSKIISKIGFKQIQDCFTSDDVKDAISEKASKEAIGIKVAFGIVSVILENLSNCKNEIYNFLSSVSGLSRTEIEEMPIADFTEMLINLIKKDEFKDFLKVVSRLTNSD